jgi:HEAT repeat protein
MAQSALFKRFVAEVNAPLRFRRDEIDELPGVRLLPMLEGEERIAAEDILIAKLAKDDGRAANALAEYGCVRAIPALTTAANESASPLMRVFAARALLELGNESGRAALADMLRNPTDHKGERALAVTVLAEFPNPDKQLLLEVALFDPHPSVRSSAVDAVLTVWGLGDRATSRGDVLLGVAGRMMSTLRSVRQEAFDQLRQILARIDAGETAEELGLTWRADREKEPLHSFDESLESDEPDFPTAGLEDLTGRERTLVEDIVILYLDQDRRAVRAAGRLGVHRAVEPLREMLRSATGEERAEIEAALAGARHPSPRSDGETG